MNSVHSIAGGNFATTKAGFAAGTTTTTSTANTTIYAIKGKAYSAAAGTNVATPTTDANGNAFTAVPKGYGTSLTFGFDSSGALKVVQGSVEVLDSAGAFIKVPEDATLPDTATAFGIVTVKVGSTYGSATWTCGTGNFAATTGLTFAFTDILTMPSRPTA